MVMTKIRRSKNKMRVPLIIMTAVLAFGLVGSFAIWSSPNLKNNASGQNQTPEEKIKNYQASIDTWETSLKEKPKDFSLLRSLADVRFEQAQLYVETGDNNKSKEVFAKSLENYLLAMDNAPAEINNKGRADLMVRAAYCASASGENNLAGHMFQEAVKLVPEDYETRSNYTIFLVMQQNFAGAKDELTKYKALLKEGDPLIAQVDQMIKGIEDIEKSAQAETNQDSSSQTEATEQGQAKSGEEQK